MPANVLQGHVENVFPTLKKQKFKEAAKKKCLMIAIIPHLKNFKEGDSPHISELGIEQNGNTSFMYKIKKQKDCKL